MKAIETVDLAEDEYVISRIAGMKTENHTKYFLIEWDGYSLEDNTWESEKNVNSKDSITKFTNSYKRENKCAKSSPIFASTKKLLLQNTFDPDDGSYYHSKSPRKTSKLTVTTTTKSSTNNNNSKKRTRAVLESETESVAVSKPVKEARLGIEKLSLEACAKFDEKMDLLHPIVRISNHNSPVYSFKDLGAKVTLVNEVDDEIPHEFTYIDQLTYIDPVQPPDPDFLPGCSCSQSSCCTRGCHDDVSAYDYNGRLVINHGTAITECNQVCGCSKKCKNRVVQRGRKIPLQVFKTKGKGWGVRSTQPILKGTFIEEYVGEVILVEEGDARGKVYDKLGCSYLFDMDFAQSELPTKYVIDSYMLGNVSRFFNHSCSPNLEVYAVFYDSADNQMHRLAFFAKRDIGKNEELCFDYNGRTDVSNEENIEGAARYACHCNSTECRKWIYH